MGKLWIIPLIITVVILANFWVCRGCWEEERFALLQLKSNINYPYGNSLPSWIDDNNMSDCCEWSNIVCNTTTKRVIQISLDSTRSFWHGIQDNWQFNASLFIPFKMLRVLSLAKNWLDGWVENQGFEKLSELSKLESLNLDGNYFNRSVLSSLSHLTSLKYLNLTENRLGHSGYERLSNLKRLESLYLSGNLIRESNVQTICSINDFTNLKELDISDNTFQNFGPVHGLDNLEILRAAKNDFNNNITSTVKQFPSLRFLDLSENRAINGSLQVINELLALEELDLSENGISSFVTNKGLPNLKILHLRDNSFNNSIFSSLKQFPSLRFLDLSANDAIKGSLQVNELLALTKLEELDLSETGVDNFITTKGIVNVSSHLQVLHLDGLDKSTSNYSKLLQSLTVFPSLNTLYFQHNVIAETHYLKNLSKLENLILDGSPHDKNVFSSIGRLKYLKVISLSGCGLSGSLPNKGWCELKNLQELRLSNNEFNGVLPPCLGNLTSLRLIDLSSNQFSGNIATSPLSRLTSLEALTIPNNHFQIPISFDSFSNHSNLKSIFAANNEVILETSFKNPTTPSYKLEFLSLSNCVGQYPRLPSFLLHQNELRIIDLSSNNVGGDFPAWLLENNTKLEGFYLGGNAFKGNLKFPQKPNFHLTTVNISENNICGQIPENINVAFPNIEALTMSWNNLVGSLPSSFGDLNSLRYLDLSNNNLTGELPQKLATNCHSLYLLKLSNNKFQGQIFLGPLHTFELIVLQLDNNNFVGKIPDSLSTISFHLESLDLSNNHLHGEIPKWIGNMSYLTHLFVYGNQLEGPFPTEFCKSEEIELLDISDNKLSGSIPSCFSPETLRHFYLSNNRFGGQLTQHPFCNTSSSLLTLDLSDNNFRGTIPKWIGNLDGLSILLLKGNHFEGIIPTQLCQLRDLSILDLSSNNLTGPIPRCLGEIMSSNRLGSFKTDVTSVVIGNPMADATVSYLKTSRFAKTFHLPLAILYNQEYNFFDTHNIRAEFTTKLQARSFQGIVLEYMLGIDLSCNQLTGNIPLDLGNLSKIYALNLSHNNLIGGIPITLSGLAKIESLDLSYNMLNGRIPAQLVQLNFLEVFSVAHNNLSGPIPDRKAQFATFDASSYEGNALLCGPPLSNLCTHIEVPPQVLLHENGKEDNNFMDMKSFYISFLIAYTVMLVTVVAVLCINPYWRRSWFSFIEFCAMSCYDYVWIAFLNFKLRMRSIRARFL